MNKIVYDIEAFELVFEDSSKIELDDKYIALGKQGMIDVINRLNGIHSCSGEVQVTRLIVHYSFGMNDVNIHFTKDDNNIFTHKADSK